MRYAEITAPRMRPTDTPEFKAWFAGSKVVDAHGDPLRVFHGTVWDFDAFRLSALGRSEDAHRSTKLGFFFATDPKLASEFAQTWDDKDDPHPGSHVKPVYLAIKNPYEMPAREFLANFEYGRVNPVQLRKMLQVQGHDGVRIIASPNENHEFHHDNWIAFDPRQIKSAVSNRTFNPKKTSIAETA